LAWNGKSLTKYEYCHKSCPGTTSGMLEARYRMVPCARTPETAERSTIVAAIETNLSFDKPRNEQKGERGCNFIKTSRLSGSVRAVGQLAVRAKDYNFLGLPSLARANNSIPSKKDSLIA
jgi:hypothetical protein